MDLSARLQAIAQLASVLPPSMLHVRHHSLFVPRDCDGSPDFGVVKPSLAGRQQHEGLRVPRLGGLPRRSLKALVARFRSNG